MRLGGNTISPELSIVIAVKGDPSNLEAILEHLPPNGTAAVEVLFCVSGSIPPALAKTGDIRILTADEQSLVPELWRDGILAATSEKVALTTAQFVMPRGWVDCLLAADLQTYVAIGGTILNHRSSSSMHWAVYLLRYLQFAPPAAAVDVMEIAADNAIYRRSEILKHRDLLKDGFWEPSFHRRFRSAGERLHLDPRLEITYQGTDGSVEFALSRYAHGREFGLARSRPHRMFKRIALAAAAPLIPFVVLGKVMQRGLKKRRYALKLIVALPWLMLFCCAWSLGEARGYFDALWSTRKPKRSYTV